MTDFTGLLLILVGGLLFFSLLSFDPKDLPSWVSFSRRAATDATPCSNILGPVGVLLAGYMLFILGAGAFFFPIILVWFGTAKIVGRMHLWARPLIGGILLVGSLSVLAAHQGIFFQDWVRKYNILGAGGGVGWMGAQVASRTIGGLLMVLVSAAGAGYGAILAAGMKPVEALHSLQVAINHWRERHRHARTAVEKEQQRAEQEASKLERENRKLERAAERAQRHSERLNRGSVRALGNGEDLYIPLDEIPGANFAEQELPLTNSTDSKKRGASSPKEPMPLPAEPEVLEPEIIDGMARKASADETERKTSLAEWRTARNNAGKSSSGMASALAPLAEAYKNYQLPDLDLLHWEDVEVRKPADKGALFAIQQNIIKTLGSFGINVRPGPITRGPTITRYEIYPTDGLRVNRIVSLEADIARATKAEYINILAPIPGKDTVGIEIANADKVPVPLRELLEDPAFHKGKARLPLALGKDVYGDTIVADLAQMPHLLVAGTTGSGKSVCINSVIASLLFQYTPDQLRFIMVDPKVVEMQVFKDLPHLIVPVVTDPKKVLMALKWCVNEMEHRYQMFASEGVRNFEGFNNRKTKKSAPAQPAKKSAKRSVRSETEPELPLFDPLPESPSELVVHQVKFDEDDAPFLGADEEELPEDVAAYYAEAEDEPEVEEIPDTVPYIVVIIDELADLMQTVPADVENLIARLTQKARAAGIHLIVATQTPRANVITGVIKANIPSRIAFQVASGLDSRVILDNNGAEKLVGKGDMLYLPPGSSKLIRAQGAFITDDEIVALVEHCKSQGKPMYDRAVQESISSAEEAEDGSDEITEEDEEAFEKCLEVISQEKKASTSLLQRRLRLGYGRAARMMDLLERRGIIGPGDGAKPREILVAVDEPMD